MWKTSLLGGIISGRIKGSGGGSLGLIKRGFSASQGSGDTQGYVHIPTNPTADPAIHSSEPQVEVKNGSDPHRTTQTEPEPFTPPKPPIASSPKLEHTEVGVPSKPNAHQKRQSSSQSAQTQTPPERITEIICSRPDLDPWPDNEENLKSQNSAQEEDNKASPLSEVEFADTRKPITQATDTNTSGGVIVFKEEQQDTVEEALLRAAEIWKWNKMRGDPDSPHGRVLRQLCGEFL